MAGRKNIKAIYRKLGKEKIWGQADFGDNSIEIDPRIKGKKHLEIMTHEVLHLLFPKLSEENIIEKSIILTNVLWKESYRRVDDNESQPLQDGSK